MFLWFFMLPSLRQGTKSGRDVATKKSKRSQENHTFTAHSKLMQVASIWTLFWALLEKFTWHHMTLFQQSHHFTQLEQLEAGTPTVFAMTSADVILTWTQHDVTMTCLGTAAQHVSPVSLSVHLFPPFHPLQLSITCWHVSIHVSIHVSMYVYVYTHRTCSKFKKASKIPSRTWQLLQVATVTSVTCRCFMFFSCFFHIATWSSSLCTSSASKTRSQTKTSNGILQETNSCLFQSCRPRGFPFHVYMVYVVYMAWFWETAAQLHDPNIRHQKTPNFVILRLR